MREFCEENAAALDDSDPCYNRNRIFRKSLYNQASIRIVFSGLFSGYTIKKKERAEESFCEKILFLTRPKEKWEFIIFYYFLLFIFFFSLKIFYVIFYFFTLW